MEQRMGHGVEEAGDLDMIVNAHSGEAPFGVFIVLVWQFLHRGQFDRVEQLLPTDAEMAHHASVQLQQALGDRGVAFGKRKKLEVAESTQNVVLGDTNSDFHFGLVLWTVWPCWENADAVMRRHGSIAAVKFGVIETRLVH